MGLQAIEAGPEYRSPVFLVDHDSVDLTTAHWAVSRSVSFQRAGASIPLPPAHWLPRNKTVGSSRRRSRVVARASVAVATCVLWLFIGAGWDNALCGESDTRAQAFIVAEKGHKTTQANARWDESLLVSLLVETAVVEQTQILKHGREKVESLAGRSPLTQPSGAPQGNVAQAPQSVPAAARERKQALEQEWFARALTSSLRGELDEVRPAADAEIKQNQALDQERARADDLARELTSLRAELKAARIAGPEVTQAAEAAIKQRQALELERNQERDRADALARELTSLRAEFETARAVGLETAQTTAVAKIEQEQAFGKEREKIETLARELAAARKEAEASSTLLAAAHAKALRIIATNSAITAEHERALVSERDRADALARELTYARNGLEAGNRQIAALNSLRALHSRAAAVDRSQERMAKPHLRAIEGKGRSPEQTSGKAAAFILRPSPGSKLPRPE
jgi:hypothetical protein